MQKIYFKFFDSLGDCTYSLVYDIKFSKLTWFSDVGMIKPVKQQIEYTELKKFINKIKKDSLNKTLFFKTI